MLASDDVRARQRLTSGDGFQVLLDEEAHRNAHRDRQPESDGEPTKEPEPLIVDAQAAGSCLDCLALKATDLAQGDSTEANRDGHDDEHEACPVPVVTAFPHGAGVSGAGTVGQQVDKLMARGQRCHDEDANDARLTETAASHALTVLGTAGSFRPRQAFPDPDKRAQGGRLQPPCLSSRSTVGSSARTVTTPFDIVMLNELDRFHLVMDVIDRVPGLGPRAAHIHQRMADKRRRGAGFTRASTARTRRRSKSGDGRPDGLSFTIVRVLVLNAGSSSLKVSVVDDGETLVRTSISWGDDATRAPDRPSGVWAALDALDAAKIPPTSIDAVGYRVVHGGSAFAAPILLDEAALAALDVLGELAPLHNTVAIETIRAARAALPGVRHVAYF